MKKIGISKNMARGIFAVLIIALATTLVSAGLIDYFGQVQTTVNVEQSVLIDGHNWDEGISHEFGIVGGCSQWIKHKIINQACVEADLDMDTTFTPDGEGITVNYYICDGWKTLRLENKNPTTWEILDDEYYADFTYNPCCPNLVWSLEGKFKEDTEYILIYYADQPDRFVNWGGAPALTIATFTSGMDGTFSESGTVDMMAHIPYSYDWNIGPDADYTQAPDNYIHGKGAKIWLIPSNIYNGDDNELGDWVPEEILFETDLIAYFDCDYDILPIYIYPWFEYGQYDTFPYTMQPGEEICLFIGYDFAFDIMPMTYTILSRLVATTPP